MDRATVTRLRDDQDLNGTLIRNTVGELTTIWDELGFEGAVRTERLDTVGFHFRELMQKMIDEERNVLHGFKEMIEQHEEGIRSLNKELGNPQFQYQGPSEVIPKETALNNELKRLTAAKEVRMVELFDLKAQEQRLCDKLVVTPGKYIFLKSVANFTVFSSIRSS